MNIPNDTGGLWRINKFVEYQNEVPPIHREIFLSWKLEKTPSTDEMIVASFLMANTYNELTVLFLMEKIAVDNDWLYNFENFWNKNKSNIQFGSAKKYIKMNDRIIPIVRWFYKNYFPNPTDKLCEILSSTEDNYEYNIKYNKQCPNFGRFSGDLYNEILMTFFDNVITNPKHFLDWKNCQNLTSGIFNLLYEDDLADRFDKGDLKNEELIKYTEILEDCLKLIQLEIQNTYGKRLEIPMFITKICSFRNLFKNKRYGGYHHDRQLEYLLKYQKDFPDQKVWQDILNYRKNCFKKHFLGELSGWSGIRKSRKKIWTSCGMTGVEL